MKSILSQIIADKFLEVETAKGIVPLDQMRILGKNSPLPRGFAKRLSNHNQPRIIAEIKRASPSKGIIRQDLDPIATALGFQSAGAACLSVLTDGKYFGGNLKFLSQIRSTLPETPLLRKDFIVDAYQVWESRNAGADAILLIVAALKQEELKSLLIEAYDFALDVLIEVHTKTELLTALEILSTLTFRKPILLGINNRNLNSFEINLETTKEIITYLTDNLTNKFQSLKNHILVISESGIFTSKDLKQLESYGAQAFLIGESLVAKGNPANNLQELTTSYLKS